MIWHQWKSNNQQVIIQFCIKTLETESIQQKENLETTDLAQHSKKVDNTMINELLTNYF
jgi:predicted SnoaL-like aldol condensation-catalyzing enzyme